MRRIYLDHNATTPIRPQAREAMLRVLGECGNASSVHAEGRAAHQRIEHARAQVAQLVQADPERVIFTSGGTEANNWAIAAAPVERIVVSATEHASVLEPAGKCGKPRYVAPVDREGVLDLDALEAHLASRAGPVLVCVMLANNETGLIQPIPRIAQIAHRHGALMHVDAVQAAGKLPLSIEDMGADSLSLSAHKLGGPQGAGALVLRRGLVFDPLLAGGGQERRRRAGTENVAAIAGFGAAAEVACEQRMGLMDRLCSLRDTFERRLLALASGGIVFCRDAERLVNTSCFAVPGMDAQMLLIALDLEGVAVSSGAACSSGKVERSHVLTAMGAGEAAADGAIRLSLGWTNGEDDIEQCLRILESVLERQAALAAA